MMRRDLVTLFPIEDMRRTERKKESGNATRVSVKKEMAKPRMARSARIAELNLNTARIPEQLAGHQIGPTRAATKYATPYSWYRP
jgi:hypothetical protein